MKRIKIISVIGLFFISTTSYGQLWHQYLDSVNMYAEQKNPQMADNFYYKAVAELEKDSLGTATYAYICESFGYNFYLNEIYNEAERLLLIAVKTYEKLPGPKYPDYVRSSSRLANLYEDIKEYKKSESLNLIVKQIVETFFGKEHPEYGTCCYNLGIIYAKMRRYDEAEQLYLQAKDIAEKAFGKQHSDYTRVCINLVSLYAQMKQYEKAIPIGLETLKIYGMYGTKNSVYAKLANNLGIIYSKCGQYSEAERLSLQAKEIRKRIADGKPDADYASSCTDLGLLYNDMDQLEKAISFHKEAKETWRKLGGTDHAEYASCCSNLGIDYVRTGQYKKAESQYREAMQVAKKNFPEGRLDYTDYSYNLADLYLKMGQFEKALSLSMESMQIREDIISVNYDSTYVFACSNLAACYSMMGEYTKAESLYVKAKDIQLYLTGINDPSFAIRCQNLASLYIEMAEYQKAEPLLIEAKRIQKKTLGEQHIEYIYSCTLLAVFYIKIGQPEKARSLILETITEKQPKTETLAYARYCSALAKLYCLVNQNEKAGPLFIEAGMIQAKLVGTQNPEYGATCSLLGSLYFDMAEYEKAEKFYLVAKDIDERSGKNIGYAYTCVDLASIYLKLGKFKKAELYYKEAKEIREKNFGKFHPEYGSACDKLAILYWVTHEPLQAEREFRESFSVNEHNLNNIFQFTNEKEKTALVESISHEDDIAFSFYLSEKIKSEQPYSISLLHRNCVLSSSQALKKQLFYSSDTMLRNKYEQWTDLKKYLSIIYSQPANEREEDPGKTEEQAAELEKDLSRLSSAFRKQQQNPNWKNIQSALKPDEASIEFVSFHLTNEERFFDSVLYVALVIRNDSLLPGMIYLFNETELLDLLPQVNNNITIDVIEKLYNPDHTAANKITNKTLYDLIWKPLEKELTGIKTVYFAPSGILHKISFAALPVNEKDSVLSDKYKLVQLASTISVTDKITAFINPVDEIQLYGGINYNTDEGVLKKIVQQYQLNNSNTRSLPANPALNDTLKDLPGTATEVANIFSLGNKLHYSIQALEGDSATEESIKALDGKKSPAIFHIATHGFFFAEPKTEEKDKVSETLNTKEIFKQSDNPLFRSGLLFAGAQKKWNGKSVKGLEDGVLTSYEVSNLYLPNTKLAVLSACETGLGDIKGSEGVYGLQRAFKMAGVQNLVMSLWKVPDTETSEFMLAFYKNMFDKQSISDAFYNAQEMMRDRYRSNPFKWAAWILVR